MRQLVPKMAGMLAAIWLAYLNNFSIFLLTVWSSKCPTHGSEALTRPASRKTTLLEWQSPFRLVHVIKWIMTRGRFSTTDGLTPELGRYCSPGLTRAILIFLLAMKGKIRRTQFQICILQLGTWQKTIMKTWILFISQSFSYKCMPDLSLISKIHFAGRDGRTTILH